MLPGDQASCLKVRIHEGQRLLHDHGASALQQGVEGLVVATLPLVFAAVESRPDEEAAAIQTTHRTVALKGTLEVLDETRQRRHSSQELGLETSTLVLAFTNNLTNLGVACAV